MSSIEEWVNTIIPTVALDVRAALSSAFTEESITTSADLTKYCDILLADGQSNLNDILGQVPALKPIRSVLIIDAIKAVSTHSPPPPPVDGVSARKDKVVLDMSTRRSSSSMSIIVDGMFSDGHISATAPAKSVKVKLAKHVDSMQRELEVMLTLNGLEHVGFHFIKPYNQELLRGARGQLLFADGPAGFDDSIVNYVGIAMERGEESLAEYTRKKREDHKELHLPEKAVIGLALVEIVAAAHKVGYVLLDFKPDNVVRVIVGSDVINKAIDFDSVKEEGAQLDESIAVTAAYASPEIAQFRHDKRPILATKAMDVFTLGLILWELISGTSFWEAREISNHSLDRTNEIWRSLCSLTTKDVVETLLKTFNGEQNVKVCSLLVDMLAVEPEKRKTSESLKGKSFFTAGNASKQIGGAGGGGGGGEDTHSQECDKRYEKVARLLDIKLEDIKKYVDENFQELKEELTKNIITSTDLILTKMYENQAQSFQGLEKVAMLIMQGNKSAEEKLAALQEELEHQKNSGSVQLASLQSKIEQLGPELSESMRASMEEISVAAVDKQNQKLDVLSSMVGLVLRGVGALKKDNETLLVLTRKIEMKMNIMPYSFVIIPESKTEKLPEGTSFFSMARMSQIASSAKRKITKYFWTTSRLVFVCPITMKPVECGPDKKGYQIAVSTETMKMLAPVLKFGLLFLKVGLASQGLGSIVPDVSSFVPGDQSDDFNEMLNQIGDDMLASEADDALQGAYDALSNLNDDDPAISYVYNTVKTAEKGDSSLEWKPKLTGLKLVPSRRGRPSKWMSTPGETIFRLFEENEDAAEKVLARATGFECHRFATPYKDEVAPPDKAKAIFEAQARDDEPSLTALTELVTVWAGNSVIDEFKDEVR